MFYLLLLLLIDFSVIPTKKTLTRSRNGKGVKLIKTSGNNFWNEFKNTNLNLSVPEPNITQVHDNTDLIKDVKAKVSSFSLQNPLTFINTVTQSVNISDCFKLAEKVINFASIMNARSMISYWLVCQWINNYIRPQIKIIRDNPRDINLSNTWLSCLTTRIENLYFTKSISKSTSFAQFINPKDIFHLKKYPSNFSHFKKVEVKTLDRQLFGDDLTSAVEEKSLGVIATWLNLQFSNDTADAWQYRHAFINAIIEVSYYIYILLFKLIKYLAQKTWHFVDSMHLQCI